MLSQESICFTKMTTAEKASMSWEGRGVRSFEDDMFFCIDERFLFLRVASPEEENQKITFIRECLYDWISKGFPSFPSMRHRLPCTDCECGIEEEYALFCPTCQISIFWCGDTEIWLNFLKYIHQWWRISHSFHDRERESMGLSWSMIGVLPKYDNLYFFEWSFVQSGKYIFWMRVYCLTRKYLIFYKLRKLPKIGFSKFCCKSSLPALFQLYFCHSFSLGSKEWRYSSMKLWIKRDVSMGSGMCVMLKSDTSPAESLAVLIMRFP